MLLNPFRTRQMLIQATADTVCRHMKIEDHHALHDIQLLFGVSYDEAEWLLHKACEQLPGVTATVVLTYMEG